MFLGGAGAGPPRRPACSVLPSWSRQPSREGRETEAERSVPTFVCSQVTGLVIPVYSVEDLTIKKA